MSPNNPSVDDTRFPAEFEHDAYRMFNSDLATLDAKQLEYHFFRYGKDEGRISNTLRSRTDFANLASNMGTVLEVGPFVSPLLRGDNVRYADVLSTDELRRKASELGRPQERVPRIDYLISVDGLLNCEESFDAVVSSHVLEHTPDCITHLRNIETRLNTGGVYLLMVPDHRYCFDHFQTPTTLSEVYDAYVQQRKKTSFKSVYNANFVTTHNQPAQHWAGEHGQPRGVSPRVLAQLVDEYPSAQQNKFFDVHSWYFTADSFSEIYDELFRLGLVGLRRARTFPARHLQNEFWVILEKG